MQGFLSCYFPFSWHPAKGQRCAPLSQCFTSPGSTAVRTGFGNHSKSGAGCELPPMTGTVAEICSARSCNTTSHSYFILPYFANNLEMPSMQTKYFRTIKASIGAMWSRLQEWSFSHRLVDPGFGYRELVLTVSTSSLYLVARTRVIFFPFYNPPWYISRRAKATTFARCLTQCCSFTSHLSIHLQHIMQLVQFTVPKKRSLMVNTAEQLKSTWSAL